MRLRAKGNIATLRYDRSKIGRTSTTLSEIDERILTMFGITQIDGHQQLAEGGFSNKKVEFSF